MTAARNPEAATLLVETAWARRVARALVGDRQVAEDVAQEALAAALTGAPAQPDRRHAWLLAVLRKLASRAHRARGRRADRERAVARDEALPSAAELVSRAEGHRRIVELVLALDEPYRSTLLLRYLEELSPTAVAARQEVPLSTVKTRLQRGLVQLRTELCDEDERRSPAWLAALAGMRAPEGKTGLSIGGGIVAAKGQLAAVAAIAVACLIGVGMFVLRDTPAVDSGDGAEELSRGESELAVGSDASPAAEDESSSRAPAVDRGASEELLAVAAVPPERAITGVVVDDQERPVADAEISAWFDPTTTMLTHGFRPARLEASARSDGRGQFELPLPAARAHDLHVRAQGFAPLQIGACTGGMQLRVVLKRAALVRGVVLDARDGQPVPGGEVRVFHGAWSLEVPVDDHGRFQFDELVPGEIGFLAMPARHAVGRHKSFAVAPGGTLEIELHVVRGLTVEGRVTDVATGAPIAGAEVHTGILGWKRGKTDAAGRYALEGVEPERRVELHVRAPGYAHVELTLDPEGVHEMDVELSAARALVGRVEGSDGAPIRDGYVVAWTSRYLDDSEHDDEVVAAIDPDGSFRVADLHRASAYMLLVRAPGHATTFFPVVVAEDGETDLGRLRIARAASVSGRILGPRGEDVSAHLELWPPVDALVAGVPLGMNAWRTDEHGNFAMGDLAAGTYRLRVVAYGHSPLDGTPVELGEGEHLTGLEVRLPAGDAIRGAVYDAQGRPIPGVLVQARRADGDRSLPTHGSAGTDDRGWFEIRDLAPGAHNLVASLGAAWEIDGAERQLAATRLSGVEPGGVPLEIVLRALDARIAGVVLGEDGEPVPSAYVWIEIGGESPRDGVLGAEDGSFELLVPDGETVELVARRTRHLSENEGNLYVAEVQIGRDIAPPKLGEARLAGVSSGSLDIELRMKP